MGAVDPVRLAALWPTLRHAGEAALLLGVPRSTIHKAAARLGLPPRKGPGRPRVPCVLRVAARAGCRCAECRRLSAAKTRAIRARFAARLRAFRAARLD